MMPSLIKYFATVGTLLALGLIGLNAVIAPGGPGPSLVKEPAKAIVVKHDPSASLVERLRDDEAARRAASRAAIPQTAAVQATPAPQPVAAASAVPLQSAAEPIAQGAPEITAPTALAPAPTEDEAAVAARLAQAKIAAEKARRKRLAQTRAKAKADEAALSRLQDQTYSSYAQRPTYGPFGQNGGWSRW